MKRLPVLLAAPVLGVLAACGGDGTGTAAPVDLPPAGGSRWAWIDHDQGADGLVEASIAYRYDGRGLLVQRSTMWHDGVEPGSRRIWHHDEAGRVQSISGNGHEHDYETRVWYDERGRLARTVHEEGPTRVDTRFSWDDERLVRVLDADTGATSTITYGADGRVAQVVRRRPGDGGADVDRYLWRDDGQLGLARFAEAVGRLVTFSLEYDAEGRHRRTTIEDDGVRFHQRRHVLDARGRTVRIEIDRDAVSLDAADFVADDAYDIRWEDGPCQPVRLPEPPPTFDREFSAEASSDRVSQGCAP